MVRGIAIIGVVFLHSSFASRFDAPALAVCATLGTLFDWAVLAFFFLSGLLQDEAQPITGFLRKRFRSLVVPFLVCNFFYNLAFGLLQVTTGRHCGGFQWHPSLLLFGWFHSPAFQLYFLPYLFGIAVTLFLLCKVIPIRGRWLMLILGFVSMVTFYQHVGWPGWSYGPELTKLPLYFIAFLMGVVGRPVLKEKPSPSLLLPLLICVPLALLSGHLSLLSLLVPPLLYISASLVHLWWNATFLQEIGRSSAAIYLWHTPILLPAFTAIFALAHVSALANLGLSVGITIAVCVVLRKVVNMRGKQASSL
jgi:peptidoglycan/LPS O-acetylase OafA/YrhL